MAVVPVQHLEGPLQYPADPAHMYSQDELFAASTAAWNKAVAQTPVEGRFMAAVYGFAFGLFCAYFLTVL